MTELLHEIRQGEIDIGSDRPAASGTDDRAFFQHVAELIAPHAAR
jgi:hypothetical protein